MTYSYNTKKRLSDKSLGHLSNSLYNLCENWSQTDIKLEITAVLHTKMVEWEVVSMKIVEKEG